MKYKGLVFGIYPRSETLRKSLNLWERGKLPLDELKQRITEEKDEILKFLEGLHLSHTDPLVNWHDILRPLALSLTNVRLGELHRYRETNTFYRQPVITGDVLYSNDADARNDGFPYFPAFQTASSADMIGFIPGPHSFLSMSRVETGVERGKLLRELTVAASKFIEAYGLDEVVIYDPIPFGGADLSYLSDLVERFRVTLISAGDVTASSLRGIGKDLHALSARSILAGAFDGPVYLQVVDSQNTRLEDPHEISAALDLEAENNGWSDVGITHTEYLDFLPRRIADEKVRLMGEVLAHGS